MSTTKQTILELEALRDRLGQQVSELRAKIDQLQKHLDSVATTLALLGQPEPAKIPQENDYIFTVPQDIVSPSDLQGLTQIEALVKIAKANNNRVRLTTARDLIVAAGLTTSHKNAMNIIFNVIKRSDKFKKASPGIYELQPDKTEETVATQPFRWPNAPQ